MIVESRRSIANKVRFAMKRGLAGIMPVYIPYDDIDGYCPMDNVEDTYGDFKTSNGVNLTLPVLREPNVSFLFTINEAIDMTFDEITQEEKILAASETTTSTTTTESSSTTSKQEITTQSQSENESDTNFRNNSYKSIFLMTFIGLFLRSSRFVGNLID